MFETIFHLLSQASQHTHTPQTAFVAILCAAMFSFFS
ncbi:MULTISPECIES: YshB family small membrane protein [Erwiniaceae]|nr:MULTISPECIES: YshB family small membrane protein [Erwiniaceae]